MTSCTQRSLRYIQDKKQDRLDTVTEYSNQPPDYLIQPYDVLYITVTTTNQEVNSLFSENISSSFGGSSNGQDQNMYFTGYTVADTGWIKVPLLGDFNVKGKTIDDIELLVNDRVKEMLIDAIVKVKLISFRVYFIGIINTTQTFYQKHVTILEAVAGIGGISDYGDKRRVMIIRKTETGYKVFRINLTERKLLESDDLYLQPNDMVYVEPVRLRSIQLAFADYSTAISLITTTMSSISTILLILKLKD